MPHVSRRRTGLVCQAEAADRAHILHVVGYLDVRGVLLLRSELRTIAAQDRWVVVDLAGVPRVDGCALPVLATAQARLRRLSSGLALWRLREQPLHLVHEAQFDRLVPVVTGALQDWIDHRRAPREEVAGSPRTAPEPPRDARRPPAGEPGAFVVDRLCDGLREAGCSPPAGPSGPA